MTEDFKSATMLFSPINHTVMLSFYPDIEPNHHFMLDVGAPHQIYVEESGNPEGLPVLFIHGGPGAGASPEDRCFFDPGIYRIIIFDQRGAGRSTPHACLEKNTTQDLIQDIEKIRKKLDIKHWVLFGGSWGVTLSLAYAQAHPDTVLGLILRGVFLGTESEIQWFYGPNGAASIFPEAYDDYLKPLPKGIESNVIEDYYQQLTNDDEIHRLVAAKAWSIWEGKTSTLNPSPETVDKFSDAHMALSVARIECHYFLNHSFLKPNQLLENMPIIANKPGIIIHGRYDVVASAKNAWELFKTWPQSKLNFIRDAGHSSREPGILDALINATNEMGARFG
jgi:proline iminopeptidase